MTQYIDKRGTTVTIVGKFFGEVCHTDQHGAPQRHYGKVFVGITQRNGRNTRPCLYTNKGVLLTSHATEVGIADLVSKVTHVWDNSDGLEASK